MERMEWVHVRGNTWCIQTHLTIPVYFLNQREVVLLDSGYAHREGLEALLREKDVRVRAILGSHSHNDHNGNHRYFQAAHGAEVILRDVEAAIVSDFALMSAAYSPATPGDLRREFPHLLLKADRVFTNADTTVTVDGQDFGLIPLPGHTPGHTGIVTPDHVAYVGDAVLSRSVMEAVKLPSTMDWQQDLESKRRLRAAGYAGYILAHSGVYQEIDSLIEENLQDKAGRAEQIFQWLREQSSWSQCEVERLLWRKLGVTGKNYMAQRIFQRNVSCVLDYLVCTQRLSRQFREGSSWYQVVN